MVNKWNRAFSDYIWQLRFPAPLKLNDFIILTFFKRKPFNIELLVRSALFFQANVFSVYKARLTLKWLITRITLFPSTQSADVLKQLSLMWAQQQRINCAQVNLRSFQITTLQIGFFPPLLVLQLSFQRNDLLHIHTWSSKTCLTTLHVMELLEFASFIVTNNVSWWIYNDFCHLIITIKHWCRTKIKLNNTLWKWK